MTQSLKPGSRIGLFGSGQLGRMFAIEARRLGYRIHVFSPDEDSPTGQLADVTVVAEYDDLDAVTAFVQQVDVVTFEFENVPAQAIDIASQFTAVRPAGNVLHTTQQRLREKRFLTSAGIPVADFVEINSKANLEQLDDAAFPAILKSANWGYDGKGQAKVLTRQDIDDAWAAVGGPAVLERFVDFEGELSVVAARGVDGQIVHYDPIWNVHRNHILDLSISPSGISDKLAAKAVEIARTIMTKLDVVGVLCVEFFLTKDGELLVNELAPRPHNSGHLTVDAHITCQFEQQVRAVCGLPLGATTQLKPAAMVNLLGDLWEDGEPQWDKILERGNTKLHLYGKQQPRVGRKMGHLTTLADSPEIASGDVLAARQAIAPKNQEWGANPQPAHI